MSTETFPIINGRVLRVTVLDVCGVPAYGNFTSATSEGFVSVGVTANYDDGEAIQVKNAGGRFCINKPAEPELTSLGIEVVFCDVNPDIYSAVTGFPKITDPLTGKTIGFKVNRGVRPADVKWALEVWSEASDSAGCDLGGDFPWAYQLWPFLQGARIGDYTIENNAVTFTATGAVTLDGNGWLEGPYLVVTDEAGDPDVLQDPLDSLDHELIVRTIVPPPLPSDGLVPLDDPADPDATTGTTGNPGVWDGVRPYDLATLQASAITSPSGVTSWVSGKYIILGDGSYAHWAGSGASPKWVAGKKP